MKKRLLDSLKKRHASSSQIEISSRTNNIDPIDYILPDKSTISLEESQYMCPELLFDTKLIGREGGSIQELITSTIKKTDHDMAEFLTQSWILTGGTTLFKGLEQRLKLELQECNSETSHNFNFKGKYESRAFSSWLGWSCLGNLSSSQELMVTKQMYEEEGPRLLANATYW